MRKFVEFRVFAILVLLIVALGSSNTFVATDGSFYDLSGLTKHDIVGEKQLPSGVATYWLRLGAATKQCQTQNIPRASVCKRDVYGVFHNAGSSNSISYRNYTPMNAGVKAVIINGDRCASGASRSSIVFCSCSDRTTISEVTEMDCSFEFRMSSPSCCPVTSGPGGIGFFGALFWFLFIASIIYFVGGSIYKYFSLGARGIEIIPNIDFWRSIPERLPKKKAVTESYDTL
ncbi:hypothetical protein PCE1_002491 [Barthelona sp. PCE]